MTKMTQVQRDSFHRVFNSILLSVIATFGVYSLILLNNVKETLNDVRIQQAVGTSERKINTERITKLENDLDKIKNGNNRNNYRRNVNND